MFTRIGAAAIKKDLGNTIALCEALGNPHQKFRTIHVAGTNGKGSVSHMLAAVLQAAGYKTGLYTSPHLKDFRERIKINGEMMPEQDVVDFTENNKPCFEKIKPSFFEMTVALAFDYFASNKVDIAIIETGLGGRLDSTNIITPELSVITNAGWDHMDMLGDTLPLIAGEKAGIIKPGIAVVIGETHTETSPVFIAKAQETNSPVTFADRAIYIENFKPGEEYTTCDAVITGDVWLPQLQCDLTGIYQQKNIGTALTAMQQLVQAGWNITEAHIRQGLSTVKSSTGLMGRWQKLSDSPLTYCDVGHNIDGITEILKQLSLMHYSQLHMVWGMVKDKDISKILSVLPKDAVYYFCNAQLPRALPAEELKQKAETYGLKGEVYTTIAAAYAAAQSAAAPEDLVFVGGSTFVVAEVV